MNCDTTRALLLKRFQVCSDAPSSSNLTTPFFFIRVTTNAGLASIRAWVSVMDLEIWYQGGNSGFFLFCQDLGS